MADKWGPHVVQQGDHVEKLAFLRGTTSGEVWSYSGNAALARKRKSMHQLLPGDVIQLPDEPSEGLPITLGSNNSYTAKVPTVDVRLVCRRGDGPIANAPYKVLGLGQRSGDPPTTGTTGPGGEINLKVPVIYRELTVVLPKQNIEYHLSVGGLDPHDEPSGVAQRLKNLGFLALNAGPEADITWSLRLFQASVGLPPTGLLDDATRKKLDESASGPLPPQS